MDRTLTYRLQRFRDLDGRTLFFATFLGSGEPVDFRIERRNGHRIIHSSPE